jgi:hypothetical protein
MRTTRDRVAPEVGLIARGDLSNDPPCGRLVRISLACLPLAPEVGLIARGNLSNDPACGRLVRFSLANLRLAPEVGFEPTTNRLTADRSTTELLRNYAERERSKNQHGHPLSRIMRITGALESERESCRGQRLPDALGFDLILTFR